MDRFEAYARHVNPGLGNFLRVSGRDHRFLRASGSTLESDRGERYDDWVTGCGSFNLGHNPPLLLEALRTFLDSGAPILYEEALNPYAGELAARLTAAAGPAFRTCFFTNSGAEAVEAALKTAIAATKRTRIVYAEGGFHGATLGALACMGRGVFRDEFEPVLADFTAVPFGDMEALERALSPGDVAAFLMEPIQCEAGIRIASSDDLRDAQDLCRRHGALFLLDEVQTGMGRTGRLFAFQHAGVEPDIFTLAKSLGGGLVPIGAAVLREGVWERAFGPYERSQIHTCTFGGNALCCRVALRALEIIDDPDFLAGVGARGDNLFGRLARAVEDSRIVRRISWIGLLGGLQVEDADHPWFRWENMGLADLADYPTSGPILMERLERKRILTLVCAHDWTVLRIEPPLDVEEAVVARFVDGVSETLQWLEANLETPE